MRTRGRKPSPALIISIIALFVSLAGTGVASVATISALSKKEKKQTRAIADREVGKLAPGLSVKSADRAGSAGSADRAGSAGSADRAGSAGSAGFATSAGTAGSATSALSAAVGGTGRGTQVSSPVCDPNSSTYVTCASVNLTLPAPARVLVIGKTQLNSSTPQGNGQCRLGTTSGQVPSASGQVLVALETATFVGVTGVFPAGTHSFGIDCLQDNLDAQYLNSQVVAVALSAN